MEPKKEYWLQSDPQQKGWGPFDTEDAAWRYLFGRESDERDRERHKEAGWYVGSINKWPNGGLERMDMKVQCITITGENAIIAADQFDWMCAQIAKVKKLEAVAVAATKVVAWDWSDNDSDCVADMEKLRAIVDAL